MTAQTKTIFIILSIILCHSVLTYPSRASEVIYQNDFESDVIGQFPNNWIEKEIYSGPINQESV